MKPSKGKAQIKGKVIAGIFILLFLILIPSRSSAQKIKTEKFFDSKLGREVEVIEGEILVRFKPGLAAEKIKEINQSHGNKTKKHSKKINIHRIQLGKGNKIENMLKMYRKNPNVVFAEPNFVAKTFTTTPSDLFFSQQWGLTKIYAPEAWDIEKGNSNVIIAIVDTGIDLDHPDLNEKIVPGYDFVNEDTNPMDDHGHGTHCAGIATAESDNAQGITGVAWESKLMPVKALDSAGQGAYSDVAEGIIYAADNGAKVINLSLGAYSYSQTLQDAVDYGYQKGCVIVAASGNDNTNKPLYPAAYSNVIAVAATDQNDERWTSSNYGDYIDVCAPGVNIYSTSLDNIYTSANGTSASTPFVSGLAALLLSQNSTLANYEVENRIRQSADDLGEKGKDNYHGYGQINAYKSLQTSNNTVHDLAIIDLSVIPSTFTIGQTTTITVTIENQGTQTEYEVLITVYVDSIQIGSVISISSIQSGEKRKVIFDWVPEVSPKLVDFTIKCEVKIVLGETEIENNIKSLVFKGIKKGGKVTIVHKKPVHQYLAGEAYELWPNDTSNEIYTYLEGYIKAGAWNEDIGDAYGVLTGPFYSWTANHFWDEDNPSYIPTSWAIAYDTDETAYSRAKRIWDDFVLPNYPINKGKAYYYLGHVIHLLEDMSAPAHVFWDDHFLGGDDEYEIYIGNNYTNWSSANASGPIYQSGWSLLDIFRNLNDKTDNYPSDDYDGEVYNSPGELSEAWCIFNGNALMPKAMEYVAGLYKYFALTVDNTNPSTPTSVTDGVSGWSNDDTPTFSWTPSTDSLSKVKGYYWSTTDSTPDSNDNWTTNTLVTLPAQSNGSHTFYVAAKDNAGNIGSAGNHSFYIDDYSPSNPASPCTEWGSVTYNTWQNDDNDPYFTWSGASDSGGSGLRGYSVYWGASSSGEPGTSYEQSSASYNPGTFSGTYYLRVRTFDNAGNYSSAKTIYIAKYDGTAPSNPTSCTETNGSPNNTWQSNVNDPNFTWSGASDSQSGVARYYYYWGTNSNGTSSNYKTSTGYNPSSVSNGTYYLRVKTRDNAGNESSWTTLFTFKYDGTTPTNPISPCSESGSVTYNTWQNVDNDPYFTWSGASDSGGSGLKGYSVYWGPSSSGEPGTSYEQSSASYNPGAFSGTYYLRVRTFDNAGNYSSKKTLYIAKYDGTAPSNPTSCTEVNGAPNNTWQNSVSNPNFTWSGASDGSGSGVNGYYYYWGTNSNGTSSNYTTTSGYNPPSVGNGTYYLRVKTKDNLGNISSWITLFTFKYDSLPPGISIVTSPTHNEDEWNITNNDPLFNWTVPSDLSNIDGFSFKLNHTQDYIPDTVKDCEKIVTSTQCINVNDGIWYFHIRARDNAGNWGATDTYGPVKIDLTAPAFPTISSSADPAKEGNITITVVASEQMSVLSASVIQNGKSPTLINMNSVDNITWTGTYTVVSGYDGAATISVSGKDLAGKPGSDLITFVVDTISPTKSEISSATHPENSPTSNSNPSFAWTNSTDAGGSGVAGYSYALNQIKSYNLDTAVETTSTSVSFTKPDGTWWFHLRAVDNAGNGSEIDRYKFIIDTSSPTFIASSSKNPAKAGEVNITIQANEKLKQSPTVTVRQNGQGSATTVATGSSDNITWIGTYTVITGYDGTAVINVSGVDLAENAGIASGNFEVDTIAPTASISMFPTSPLKTGEFQIVLTLTDASNIPQKPSLSYTLSGGLLTSVPLTGSDKSWSGSSYIDSTIPEGMAMFSFSATDAAGNIGTTITAGKTFEIDTTIDASSGGTSSNSDGTMVNVPQDAFSENVNIRITYPDPNLSEIREADNNIIDDKGIKPIKIGNLYREIVAVGDIYGNEIENSDKPVTISIPYPDEDQNGMVDGTTIEEETLRMFHLDETLKKWILVPNSQVDSTGNNVSAEISNFSIYTLMQLSAPSSLSEVFGYPNPCYVKKDGYVRISNIPLDAKNVKIYIYNVAGELVRVLEEHEEIETQVGSKIGKWDGKNEDKEMVASGIYIYLIKSEGSKKTEKIAIFW